MSESFYSDFAEYYEAVFPFREEVFAFLRSYLPAGSRRILDVGCGTGHYCGRLAADGFEAVGIDLDPKMIAAARDRYPAPSFLCLDMREVGTLSRTFDAAYCIGNVASHLTQAEVRGFLGGLARILKPSGLWILQVVNWDYILGRDSYRFPPRTVEPGSAMFFRDYQDISSDRVRFSTRLAAGDRTIFAGEVWLHPIRSDACQRLHQEAGFTSHGHYADFGRTPFDPARDSGSVFVFRRSELRAFSSPPVELEK
jgi:SAM-dependent methyltransferase